MLKYVYRAQGRRFGYYVENRLKGPLPVFFSDSSQGSDERPTSVLIKALHYHSAQEKNLHLQQLYIACITLERKCKNNSQTKLPPVPQNTHIPPPPFLLQTSQAYTRFIFYLNMS